MLHVNNFFAQTKINTYLSISLGLSFSSSLSDERRASWQHARRTLLRFLSLSFPLDRRSIPSIEGLAATVRRYFTVVWRLRTRSLRRLGARAALAA